MQSGVNVIVFLCLLYVSFSSQAQFEKTKIDSLVSDISNYADSNCTNDQYFKSAQKVMSELNGQAQLIKDEKKQIQATDALRDAYSGIREGGMSKLFGNANDCPPKIRESIRKLKTLQFIDKPANPSVIIPTEKVGTH